MYEFLAKNMIYPTSLERVGKNAKVITSFLVFEDGTLTDIKVMEGSEEEAIRVIKAMPKWKPGKEDGIALVERFTLPIAFQLAQ